MDKSEFVYVTYIRTTPEKLWSALTSPEFMKQYWFGMHFESDWKAGSLAAGLPRWPGRGHRRDR